MTLGARPAGRPVDSAQLGRRHARKQSSSPKQVREPTVTISPLEPAADLLTPRRAGHPPIETLVALHERDVRSAIRRVFGRSQDEDDLVQEVFTGLVVRLRQPGELCVGAWVRAVAHNLAVDELRRRRPVPVDDVLLDRPASSGVEEEVFGADLYGRVVEAAYVLPARQRAALAASLGGSAAGVADVACTLGVSVHAAESLLSRARLGLRSHLAATSGSEAGSARPSLAAAPTAVLGALGLLLRRWRAAAAVTALAGAVAVVPAVVEHQEPESPGISSPSPVPSTAWVAGDATSGTPAEDVAEAGGDDTVEAAHEAPGPPPSASAPESTSDDDNASATVADLVSAALPGADLPVVSTCVVADVLLEAAAVVGESPDRRRPVRSVSMTGGCRPGPKPPSVGLT